MKLESLLNRQVTLFCVNYIYTGKLTGVDRTLGYVTLKEAAIVYETGPLGDKVWRDAQPLPNAWSVQISAIESFGILK